MENYLRQQIAYCITRINEYANRPNVEATHQWYYWTGRLEAYQSMLSTSC